jgi:hypothetical protein
MRTENHNFGKMETRIFLANGLDRTLRVENARKLRVSAQVVLRGFVLLVSDSISEIS